MLVKTTDYCPHHYALNLDLYLNYSDQLHLFE